MSYDDIGSVLEKMRSFCAYTERCRSDVSLRLGKWPLSESEKEEIISILEQEGFLNKDRYLSGFVRGKFLNNHWGRVKIKYELRLKGFTDAEITHALSELDHDQYTILARRLIEGLIAHRSSMEAITKKEKEKVIRTMLSRGFEYEVIRQIFSEGMEIQD